MHSTDPRTPPPVTTGITTSAPPPLPEQTPYPGAIALKQEAPFGTTGKNGTATVYKAEFRSTYDWSSPSFNSPHEQLGDGGATGTQRGYNTEKPKDGNIFLFTYVRLTNTGTDRIAAPIANPVCRGLKREDLHLQLRPGFGCNGQQHPGPPV